jgi:hypothetical protein
LLIFALSWLFRFNDPNGSFAFLTDDHFFYLVRGWQILLGDLPVRDFVDHGAPLYYYVAAAVQWIGGRGTYPEIVFSVTMISLGAAMTSWLAMRASGSMLVGATAGVLQILLAPRFYNYPKILVYAVAVPALWAFIDTPTSRRRFGIALVTVVGFLFRHDHGAFVGAGMAAALCLSDVPWRARLRHAAAYGLLVVGLLSPYLLFVQLHGGIGTYLRQASAWAARDRARAPLLFPGVFDNPDGVSDAARQSSGVDQAIAVFRDNGAAWVFYAEIALPMIALVVLLLSRDGFRAGWPRARAKIAVVAALGLVLNAGFLRSPIEARLADPSVPHAILLAWLVVAAFTAWRRSRPVALGATTLVLPVLVVFAVAVTANLSDRLDAAVLLEGPSTALRRAAYMRTVMQERWPLARLAAPDDESPMKLAFYLQQCTKPTDRVLMQYYLPQVLALAERGFAGGHADLRPGFFTLPEAQRLTIARLERQSVPIVLLETGESLAAFRRSFPLITAYLDAHYVAAGERWIDDRYEVHLLVERTAVPTRHYEILDWPCFN